MNCPKCESNNIECDTPNKPWFFDCECDECGTRFWYDEYTGESEIIEEGITKEEYRMEKIRQEVMKDFERGSKEAREKMWHGYNTDEEWVKATGRY